MTGKTIGRNTNVNDGTDVTAPVDVSSGITLNALTSTTVVVANEFRIGFYLSNPNIQNIFIKFQPASTDNDQKGIFLSRNATYEMPTDNIYTGEISAIAKTGNPIIFITEY